MQNNQETTIKSLQQQSTYSMQWNNDKSLNAPHQLQVLKKKNVIVNNNKNVQKIKSDITNPFDNEDAPQGPPHANPIVANAGYNPNIVN